MKNKRRLVTGLAFLLPVAVLLCLYIIEGIYPFGDRTFLSADLYHQYMPFFSELLHKIRGGESLGYSFHMGIGSNFLALFVYYLASPFHLLALLVPEAYLSDFIGYMVILKVGLCGLTCCVYLREHFQTQEPGTMLFSLFYALSGFLSAYNYNIMWLDCVILLPLIVLGLERLVKEGRCGLYCVTLALSIYTNYYLSIMICIFLVLYFVLMLVLEKKRLRSIGYFVLYSLLAGGMAAVLLIPEVAAILKTDFGKAQFPTRFESYFSVLDILARHCMCVASERGLAHWPNIFCGSAVLMLLPMYVLSRRISVREKFCRLALAGFLLLSFGSNLLDFIWHGLNYPDSLPARQSFLYIFLVLTMCYDAYRHVREEDERQILYGYLAAVGFFLFCEKFADDEDFYYGVQILTLAVVSVYAVLLHLYRTRESSALKIRLAVIATAVAVAELGVNTYVTGMMSNSRSEYLDPQADYRALYERTQEREDGLYRLEKFTRMTKNDSALAGYPSASIFSSTMNSDVMDLYSRFGMRHSKVYYAFDGATPLTSALLNVKYMFGEAADYENSLYTLSDRSGDVWLYECNAALPFGYVAPTGYELPEGSEDNGLQLQNRMVQELGGTEGELFRQVLKGSGKSQNSFTAPEAGIYYGILTSSGTAKLELEGANMSLDKFSDLKKGSVLYLGYLEKGQRIVLKNGDEEDETPEFSADVYRLDETVLQGALDMLSERHLENVKWESDKISGDIALDTGGRLILSVPYEEGWTVTINGHEATPTTFGGCLMAFDLEPGEYSIEMHYVPAGTGAGIAVSLLSIALFAALTVFSRRHLRHRDHLRSSAVK